MNSLLRILSESLKLTIQQLWNNKLRTFLSLLGITIGIFSIISILTAVDALKSNIDGSINSLGDKLLFVEKWPWSFSTEDYPWWEYYKRPEARFEDYEYLHKHIQNASAIAYSLDFKNVDVKNRGRTVGNLDISGVTQDYGKAFGLKIENGRYFTTQENYRGNNVAVIGGATAEKVFPNSKNPIGAEFEIFGKQVTVIGVLEMKGQDLLGLNFDKTVLLPYHFADKNTSVVLQESSPQIVLKANEMTTLQELKLEIVGKMRSARRLRPKNEDNFAINQLSIISKSFEGVYKALNLLGWIIGFFAVLVGGFGIANIMFVSVSERTKIIGIKKAMGAKRNYILSEFLIESILLCLLGGLLGLAMVYVLSGIATKAAGFSFALNLKNVIIGVGISILIGILSGILPALKAAKMDPVEAIRSK